MKATLRQAELARTCARSWEVEAARDGRLSGDALDAVQRHAQQCSECREVAAYFDGLGRSLRSLEEPAFDDIAVRSLRQKILGVVDARMAGRSLPPSAASPSPLRSIGRARLVVLAAALALVVTLVRGKRSAMPPSHVASPKTVDAIDEGGARWSETTTDGAPRIDLSDGTLRVRVEHFPGSKPLVVRVPDGEIEDIGTIFHVVVRDGKTRRVTVDEGHVTVRLADTEPIMISSGASWERREEAVVAASSLPSAPAPASSARPSVTFKRPEAAPVATALEGGGPSAALEDAAYLRTISLLRQGRATEAKAAAKDYLERFPSGFRREEMTHVAEE